MEWDSIGVAGIPEAADEYDCMISPLMHRLFDGASVADLAAWIAAERVEHFGLGPNSESDAHLAGQFVDWWTERTAR